MRDWLDAHWSAALAAFRDFADESGTRRERSGDDGDDGIAPIVQTVEVKASPERAFEAFTGSMGDWWPKGMTIGGSHHVAVVIEPRAGGRWFERDAEGRDRLGPGAGLGADLGGALAAPGAGGSTGSTASSSTMPRCPAPAAAR